MGKYGGLICEFHHVVQLFRNKLKSLKVAKSKDDDGGAVDGSVDAGDVNCVLMLCVMVILALAFLFLVC